MKRALLIGIIISTFVLLNSCDTPINEYNPKNEDEKQISALLNTYLFVSIPNPYSLHYKEVIQHETKVSVTGRFLVATNFIRLWRGGGSGTPIDLNTPADFVMEVPVDTTEYVNADDMTDMATFNPLSVKMAYADTILQMPPLTSNVIQSWCEGDGATLYDEADPAGISLLPLIGERKKLVVGEQYQLIVEADRLTQYNPCSHGRAVTGGWSFEITGVTVGEIEDNVIILDQFETGELVIEILDNGTDYSVAPVVTIALEGTDYSGPITGSAEFEIIKDPIQVPHANRLKFDGKEVKSGLIDNVVPLLQELRAATYWLSDEVLAVARKLSGE